MKRIQMLVFAVCCLLNIAWTEQAPKEEAYMQKAYQAWKAGNLTESMTNYERVLSIKPDQVEAMNFLGVIYEEMGYSKNAEEKYLTVIKLDRNFLAAYFNLGLLYWNRGDLQNAIHYLQKRIERGNAADPWTIKAKKALQAIEAKKLIEEQPIKDRQITTPVKTDKPVKIAKAVSAQKLTPDQQQRLKLINEALDKINLEEEPVQVSSPKIRPKPPIQKSEPQNENQSQAQEIFTLGQQLAGSGRYQEAIQMYDKALKITPGVPQIIKARVDAYLQWKQQITDES